MSREINGHRMISVLLMIASIVLLLIGVIFIFNTSSQVPLWVPVGAFAASSWLSVIRFRIIGGRK